VYDSASVVNPKSKTFADLYRHPCKSSVKEKHTWPGALARARSSRARSLARIWRLSAVVPAFAEPDIHGVRSLDCNGIGTPFELEGCERAILR